MNAYARTVYSCECACIVNWGYVCLCLCVSDCVCVTVCLCKCEFESVRCVGLLFTQKAERNSPPARELGSGRPLRHICMTGQFWKMYEEAEMSNENSPMGESMDGRPVTPPPHR